MWEQIALYSHCPNFTHGQCFDSFEALFQILFKYDLLIYFTAFNATKSGQHTKNLENHTKTQKGYLGVLSASLAPKVVDHNISQPPQV